MKKPILIIAIISSCLLLFLLVENFNMTSIYSYFFGEDDMYVPAHYAAGDSYQNASSGLFLSERSSVFDSNDKVPSAYSNISISGSSSHKTRAYFDNSTATTASSVTLGNANYLSLASSAETNNGYHISKSAPATSDGGYSMQSTNTMALVASVKNGSPQNLAINNSSTLPSAETYGKISNGGGLLRDWGDDNDEKPVVGGETGTNENTNNRNDMPVGGGLGIMLLMAGFYFVTKRCKNMISRA